MNELTPKQRKNLERLAKILDKGNVGVFEHLVELEEKFEEAFEKIEVMNDSHMNIVDKMTKNILKDIKYTLTNKDVKDIVQQVSEIVLESESIKGEDGKDYVLTEKDKQQIAKLITIPIVDKVIEKIEVIRELPNVTEVIREEVDIQQIEKDIEDKLPQFGTAFRDGLELLKEDERLDISAIKGIDKKDTKLTDSIINRAIGIVDQRTSFLINKVSNLKNQVDNLPVGGDSLPDQTGNSGKFLTTDGTDASWGTPAGSGDMVAATYDPQAIEGDAFDTDNHTDGTTNKVYTATEKTKLAGIEASADVTDTANVTSAGALMDSEVTSLSGIKSLTVPDSTTITAAAATVLDDTTVGAMVNTLGGASSTGTGGLVRATSPTLVTPALGTPASGVATNITGLVPANIVAGTLAAKINLGEGADTATIGLEMDSSLSADERYSGTTISGTAGATIAFGDLCYLDVTAGEWLLADASAVGTAGSVILGICVDASTDGAATSLLLLGTVRSAAFPASVALGAPVYVSETAGDITSTSPSTTDSVIRVVGYAITTEPNTFYFSPSPDHITHV